jgi:hypothetical protein
MPRAEDIHTLPDDLPVPEDDGAADDLLGAAVPGVELKATTGEPIRVDQLGSRIDAQGRIERVFYPVFPPDTHAREVLDWLAG